MQAEKQEEPSRQGERRAKVERLWEPDLLGEDERRNRKADHGRSSEEKELGFYRGRWRHD